MKTKKNLIKIESIYFDLIQKNLIPILIIFVLSIGISFLYNNLKTLKYEYYIDINSKQALMSESVILDNLENNYLNMTLVNFLLKLPKNVNDKNFSYDEDGARLSFKSNEELKLRDDFIEAINLSVKNMILKRFESEISKLEKLKLEKLIVNKKKDLSNFFNFIENNPDIKELNKIENINSYYKEVTYYKEVAQLELETNHKISELKFYLENFNNLANDDIFFSLNGWIIKDNNFNNKEKFFAGLILAILINAFYLFFKSNYFRKFFKN